ncbi:acyloxyacyl hydrolase [Persicirhabdus sediminis]|uniref:Acyloxyacyl hydrolase n=2 Tax=Persicirhabdus sediminis TaxID=454144 RepID=A0A8J7MFG9_9BACT|nr:acyloxyacyl hydrolase [Persicirhabdus sediminis]
MKTILSPLCATVLVLSSQLANADQWNLGLGYGKQPSANPDQNNSSFDLSYTFYRTSLFDCDNWEFQLGAGYSYLWTDADINEDLHLFSIKTTLRYYFLERDWIRPFLNVTIAPAYMTEDSLGYRRQGSNFIFDDHFGVGAYFGENKDWEVMFSYRHLSNANLSKPNPGIDIPFNLSIGKKF